MALTVASWNIEKNGKSSDPEKQTKVSDFIDACCTAYQIDVIFLCEVHSARLNDYFDHLRGVYSPDYVVDPLAGGYSNAYTLLVRADAGIEVGFDWLQGLNRGILLVHKVERIDPPMGAPPQAQPQMLSYHLALAHFKSGQQGLTKHQLRAAAQWLHEVTGDSGRWAITGDMNWDISRAGELELQFPARPSSCWQDATQRSGNILDWCLAGAGMEVQAAEVQTMFPPETFDMTGPDHRPVLFRLQ